MLIDRTDFIVERDVSWRFVRLHIQHFTDGIIPERERERIAQFTRPHDPAGVEKFEKKLEEQLKRKSSL